MKVECIKKKLSEALYKADKITGKNLTLPILSCILLKAKGSTLAIEATNLDLGIKIEVPARVSKEGTCAVPGQVLSGLISELSEEGNVSLEVKDGNLSVSTKNTKTLIKCQSTEDFPIIPDVPRDHYFKIKIDDLVKGLRAVYYSSATSSMKPELSSVFIHTDGGGLVFTATDSFRLAEKKISMKNVKDFTGILIPYRNASEIVRVFDNISGEAEFRVTKSQIALITDGLYLVSRVIDGSFPNYQEIIPKEFSTETVLLKQDLISALKISNIFSNNFNETSFTVAPSKKTVKVVSENGSVGHNDFVLDSASKGDDFSANFNHKYITECFQSIPQDSVSLSFSGIHKPMVIRGVGDSTFTYLVMPMNK